MLPHKPPNQLEAIADVCAGGGKGNWSAWKAAEMARRYEAAGGDYKDTGDNKNKAEKGEPEKKPGAK